MRFAKVRRSTDNLGLPCQACLDALDSVAMFEIAGLVRVESQIGTFVELHIKGVGDRGDSSKLALADALVRARSRELHAVARGELALLLPVDGALCRHRLEEMRAVRRLVAGSLHGDAVRRCIDR